MVASLPNTGNVTLQCLTIFLFLLAKKATPLYRICPFSKLFWNNRSISFYDFFLFQTSGLFKIDPKTGEVSTALPLTGKGRQVGPFSLPITKFLPRKDFRKKTESDNTN